MSTPPNSMNSHGYGQQPLVGYADQYQQQQQQPPLSAYPGYPPLPPTYGGSQPVLHHHHQPAMPAAPASNLTDALASIPDEQKVRNTSFFSRGLVKFRGRVCAVKCQFTHKAILLGTHHACSGYDT